jgi:RND family efflux transporter MFP subunit
VTGVPDEPVATGKTIHDNSKAYKRPPQQFNSAESRGDPSSLHSPPKQKIHPRMKKISEPRNSNGAAPAGRRLWAHLLALPAGIVLLAGCGKAHRGSTAAQPELPSVQVRTQTVEAKPLASNEEVVGTVRASLRATIEARTTGRITDLPVVLGQRIRAGELIARLDAPEIKARLEQAEASLQQAERDSKRMASLSNTEAVSRADHETADSRFRIAQGILAEAQALMGFAEIHAPFDGVVTRKWVDAGDQAAPGKPLVDIEDPSRLQLEADVPEAIASSIKQDVRMTIRVGPSLGNLSGTVAEIAPIADPTSRTFRVKLELPASPGLMSGQFARLVVPVGENTSVRVPASTIVQRGQMEILFVVENQHARLHLVKTGRRVNDEIEILSGLDSGDSVVIENPKQLVDGQPLQEK